MNFFNKLNKSGPFGFQKYFRTVKSKLILWFVIIGSIPSIGVGTYAVLQQSAVLEHEGIQSRGRVLFEHFHDIRVYLNEIQFDLEEISGRITLHKLLEALPTQDPKEIRFWRRNVQEDFSRFLTFRERYTEIQFIDLKGKEVLRVNFDDKVSTVQPEKGLSDMAGDPFVMEVLALNEGELSILPIMSFNPNMPKHGLTKPAIRYGKALFTPSGKKTGVFILTASANKFLKPFANVATGKIMLMERSGYFVSHPDLKTQASWATIQRDEKFQNYYSNEILIKMLESGTGIISDHPTEIISFQKFNFNPQNPNDIWLGVYSVDRASLMAPVTDLRNKFIIIILIVIGLVVFTAIIFGESLTKPLRKVVEVAVSIKEGNMDQEKLNMDSEDEFGVLANTFDAMVDTLRNNIQSMGKMAEELNSSSSEISAAAQQQSAVASQQSTSITEITATLEELTSSSAQIADNSGSVVNISSVALEQSENGMRSIEEIKEKMGEITSDNKESTKEIVELGKKSRDIGKIMEIINNIADQTKLIAFNAAIEASSAGEAGKRFGVVAVEIRQLADSVMISTEEITNKIEEIQEAINKLVIASEKGAKNISAGNNLATQTLEQLRDLVSGSKSTKDAAGQISHSTQQQMTATEQVLTALREIEKGIQQSSASIKQISTITGSLTDSSKILKDLVGEYKISHSK